MIKLTRRQIVCMGVAAGAVSALPPLAAKGTTVIATPSVGFGPPDVVVDRRWPEGRAFAAAAARVCGKGTAIDADPGPLYQELAERWTAHGDPLVGLTQDAVFVLLRQLAAERGCRLAYVGRHRHHADGTIEHVLEGPRTVTRALAACLSEGGEWASLLGAAAAGLVAAAFGRNQQRMTTHARRPPGSPGYLVSWAFVPVPVNA